MINVWKNIALSPRCILPIANCLDVVIALDCRRSNRWARLWNKLSWRCKRPRLLIWHIWTRPLDYLRNVRIFLYHTLHKPSHSWRHLMLQVRALAQVTLRSEHSTRGGPSSIEPHREYLLTNVTPPNTFSGFSGLTEQFHLADLNWCWHSSMASLAPALTACKTVKAIRISKETPLSDI